MKNQSLHLLGNVTLAVAFALCLTLAGCQPDEESLHQNDRQLTSTPALEHILSLGFAPGQIEEFSEFYLVEGDILFYKDQHGQGVPNTEQASTNALISGGNQDNITVRIDASLPSSGTDNWRPEIQQAINDWNAVSCSKIRLVLTTSSTADITVRSDFGSLPDDVIASATFPANGNAGPTVQINLDFLSNRTVSTGQKRYNMVHEFGHCLGFRHTNWASRGESVGSIGANYIPETPINDNLSVMNGGTALNSWIGFSNFDVTALRNIYPALTASCPAPFFRYFGNTNHFYTTNWAELGSGRNGYNLDQIQCRVFGTQASGTVPLYRYYNGAIRNHFYTTNFNELGNGGNGYIAEGIACYVYPGPGSGRVPLYRYYITSLGNHFYTTNFNELGSGGPGVSYEGIACYVLP